MIARGRKLRRNVVPGRRARRLWHVSPDGFGELRRSCLLSRKAAAEFLGVSLRTVAYWEAGRCRVPLSVVRLLRIVRLGDLGALSRDWSGWSLHGGALRSPEGRAFTPHESAWWALLVAQARAFVEGRARLGGVGAAAPARPQAVPLQPEAGEAGRQDADAAGHGQGVFPLNALEGVLLPVRSGWAAVWSEGGGARARPACSTGLVSYSTKATRHAECEHFPSLRAGGHGGNLGPLWPHGVATNAHDLEAQPAPSCGLEAAGRGPRPAYGSELERPLCHGPAQSGALLVPQLRPASCAPGWPSGHDRPVSGCPGGLRPGARATGRVESALPVRQREEVQALSWRARRAVAGEQGAAPGQFDGSPGAAVASTTGGEAPMEFVA